MQSNHSDRRDATVMDLDIRGETRRVLVVPFAVHEPLLSAYDAITGELLLSAQAEFFRLNAAHRGVPSNG